MQSRQGNVIHNTGKYNTMQCSLDTRQGNAGNTGKYNAMQCSLLDSRQGNTIHKTGKYSAMQSGRGMRFTIQGKTMQYSLGRQGNADNTNTGKYNAMQ